MLLFSSEKLLESEQVDLALIDWRAHKIPTAVGSTLASETTTVKSGLGQGLWCRGLMMDILYKDWTPRVENWPDDQYRICVDVITDCASLWDHIRCQTKSPKDERTRIPILVVRSDLEKPRTGLRWSPTHFMIADVDTKPNSSVKPELLKMMTGTWKWVAPKDEDTAGDASYVEALKLEAELEEAECLSMECWYVEDEFTATSGAWTSTHGIIVTIFQFLCNLVGGKQVKKKSTELIPHDSNAEGMSNNLQKWVPLWSSLPEDAIDDDTVQQWCRDKMESFLSKWEDKGNSWWQHYQNTLRFLLWELPILIMVWIWQALVWWRSCHEHIMCVAETISIFTALYVLVKKWKSRLINSTTMYADQYRLAFGSETLPGVPNAN